MLSAQLSQSSQSTYAFDCGFADKDVKGIAELLIRGSLRWRVTQTDNDRAMDAQKGLAELYKAC